jgi:hypothetical protein
VTKRLERSPKPANWHQSTGPISERHLPHGLTVPKQEISSGNAMSKKLCTVTNCWGRV